MDWNVVASGATAIGVVLIFWQIRLAAELARSQFEDSINEQFRGLAKEIPVDALIGRTVPPYQWSHTREIIYNYLDLSNEQVFLRMKKRVRKDPWHDWCAGISENLQKPAFQDVWREVKEAAPGTFTFLERLEENGYSIDPARWKKAA